MEKEESKTKEGWPMNIENLQDWASRGRKAQKAVNDIMEDIERMKSPSIRIVLSTGQFVLIQDIGPWETHPTITNGAELVVQDLVSSGKVQKGQRLFYIDSDGDPGELVFDIVEGFKGFAPIISGDQVAIVCMGAWKEIMKYNKKISG